MSALAGYNAAVYLTGTSTAIGGLAYTNPSNDHQTFVPANANKRYLDPTVALTVQLERDDVQSVSISGGPTGGTFTLTWNGQTTAALAYNATAAQVQSALQALTNIGAGNVTVTGSVGSYTVEFTGTLGFALQNVLSATSSLTGGTAPSVTPARVNSGFGYTTQPAANYSVQYVGAIITLAAAIVPVGACNVQIIAGNYLPYSFMGYGTSAELQTAMDVLDSTAFTNPPSPWKTKIPSLVGATIKLNKFLIDATFINIINTDPQVVITLYSGANVNQRYEGFAIIKTDGIKADVKALNTEGLDFEVNGQLYFIQS